MKKAIFPSGSGFQPLISAAGCRCYFESDCQVIREVTKNNLPILLAFWPVFFVTAKGEYSNMDLLPRLEYEPNFGAIMGILFFVTSLMKDAEFWFKVFSPKNYLENHSMTTTITVRQVVKIHNRQLYITLPEGFDYEEVEVIVLPALKPNDHISFWDSSDVDMAGKIGQSSSAFPEDDEDYSKW